MKSLTALLTASLFFLSVNLAFSQESNYEKFWRREIRKVFEQFRNHKGDKVRGSVREINGHTYFIKYLNKNKGGVISVCPAVIEELNIYINSKKERTYQWKDNGDRLPAEDELISDEQRLYFGLEPPERYLPKISIKHCA